MARDLLVGLACAGGYTILRLLVSETSKVLWPDLTNAVPIASLQNELAVAVRTIEGFRHAVSALLTFFSLGTVANFFFTTLIFLILRILLRRDVAATATFAIGLGLLSAARFVDTDPNLPLILVHFSLNAATRQPRWSF